MGPLAKDRNPQEFLRRDRGILYRDLGNTGPDIHDRLLHPLPGPKSLGHRPGTIVASHPEYPQFYVLGRHDIVTIHSNELSKEKRYLR